MTQYFEAAYEYKERTGKTRAPIIFDIMPQGIEEIRPCSLSDQQADSFEKRFGDSCNDGYCIVISVFKRF